MERHLMKCGCVNQGYRVNGDEKVPACLVHDCIDVDEGAPDLSGRTAQCAYGHHKPRPSGVDLAFFKYRGPGSPEATEKCKCGYHVSAHYPRWRATINVLWKRDGQNHVAEKISREFHAPPEQNGTAAEAKADFFRNQKTNVLSATVEKIEETRSELKCKKFVPHGPHEFDEYYCGCHGWD